MVDVKTVLGPEYETLVAELLASGNYSTEEEVLRDAVRRLAGQKRRDAERLATIHAAIDEAEAEPMPEPFDREAFLARMHEKHPV